MTDVRYLQIDEILAVARAVNGTEHSVRDMGLLVSAIERPRTNVFGAELYPTLHEKAAALLHSVARNHALTDGNKRTSWLATRVFLRFNGVSAGTVPPPVSVAGPFVEDVAQDNIDVPVIAKRRVVRACRPGGSGRSCVRTTGDGRGPTADMARRFSVTRRLKIHWPRD